MIMIDNIRYKELEVKPGTYIPEVGIDYPEDNPVARLYKPVYDREVVVDEHYPYVDDTRKARWTRALSWAVLLRCGLGIVLRVKMGLRIKGRENLRRYKKELAGGAITVANHMFRLDASCVLLACRTKHTV